MPNQLKQEYVSDLYQKLQNSAHFLLIDFDKTSHQKLEDFRSQIRELADNSDANTDVIVVKNSLFKVALEKIQKSEKKLTEDELQRIQSLIKGQTILFLMPAEMSGDWLTGVKKVNTFAKGEDGMTFKAGYIDGMLYEADGLEKLAALPSKEELAVKIINALRSSQTRVAYSLKFNTMKLVNVIKNASEKKAAN